MTTDHLIAFLLGSLAGANLIGLIAVFLHRRHTDALRDIFAANLASSRRKAYASGYEARAALELKARNEQA